MIMLSVRLVNLRSFLIMPLNLVDNLSGIFFSLTLTIPISFCFMCC